MYCNWFIDGLMQIVLGIYTRIHKNAMHKISFALKPSIVL